MPSRTALRGCCAVIFAARNATVGIVGQALFGGGGLGTFAAEEVDPVGVQAPNGVLDAALSQPVIQPQAKSEANALLAQSAGDLQDAPWPDGATEFVDLHADPARTAGVRYAVIVVNNYAGMPFSLLERGLAGIMLHWLDVQARGSFAFNNVETSSKAITRICPALMAYFSGVRASMYDLGLMHIAARYQRAVVRGRGLSCFVRRSDETVEAFHLRPVSGDTEQKPDATPAIEDARRLAILHRGNVAVPDGSNVYALFRERWHPGLSASDLLS